VREKKTERERERKRERGREREREREKERERERIVQKDRDEEPRCIRDFSPNSRGRVTREIKIEILRHVPMVTRCPPCGVERIGSRSPGALGLFWDIESTAPGRSSPRPRTASPYPTMWSLPSVVFVRSFFCVFFVFVVLFFWFFFFSFPCVSHYSIFFSFRFVVVSFSFFFPHSRYLSFFCFVSFSVWFFFVWFFRFSFGFFRFLFFRFFFPWPWKIREWHERVVGGRAHRTQRRTMWESTVIVRSASQYSRIFVRSIRRNDVETEERNKRDQ